MQTMRTIVEGEIRKLELPPPEDEVLPGIRWGAFDELLTPAYWKGQAWQHQEVGTYDDLRLGGSLNRRNGSVPAGRVRNAGRTGTGRVPPGTGAGPAENTSSHNRYAGGNTVGTVPRKERKDSTLPFFPPKSSTPGRMSATDRRDGRRSVRQGTARPPSETAGNRTEDGII